MKILGYILKGMSLYIFVTIARTIYSMISGEIPKDVVSRSEETGYVLGQVVIIVIASFLAYLLFKYSNKLIRKKPNQVDVKQ
jgi:hypothetical protein